MTAEELLKNLLAIIHRDGGHYVAEHGLEEATDDAIAIVGFLREQLDSIEYDTREAIRDAIIKLNTSGVVNYETGIDALELAAKIARTAEIKDNP